VFALAPTTAVVYRPFLLTAFIVTLFVSLVCIAWLLRGLLQPYSQLVGEARRAPVTHSGRTQNEAAFVLETFQSVIAQLQAQQQELERLSDQASQRADSAERFSERIVASMPTGLIAFDSSGRATVVNRPARVLFESEPHAPGEHFGVMFSHAPALAEMVEACLANGTLFRREEIEATNGLGQPKRLGATVAPIDPTNESGPRGALCLLTDITEVTRLREQVALKRNLESLGEMSAGLAHEFKNAMAALHGYAQFLQSIDHDEQGKAAADALLQEVRNLSEMTTAFLNFARPQPLQLEEVSLDELIEECARELAPLFEERKVELILAPGVSSAPPLRSLRLSGEPSPAIDHYGDTEKTEAAQRLEVRADARMLRQALLNLLRNAAEAIEDTTTNRRVTVAASTESDQSGKQWAVISIEDTGNGIPASDLQKIFIPFFTTKSQGHGVGLALAHRVITGHGGTLTAASAPEGGAVFEIRLPA
ncbi:MAG TPA: ATP-binding protein, partial [Pyrinomonadaceae bacterium]|nr:ATP-binding protein [Pyrinomonadaceae bacterium]